MNERAHGPARASGAAGGVDALQAGLAGLADRARDLDEQHHLADGGGTNALDESIKLAVEREDLDELRHLANEGSATAGEILEELTEG